MEIYCVLEPDGDAWCGNWLMGVFSTLEKAKKFKEEYRYGKDCWIEKWDLDEGKSESTNDRGKREVE